MAALEPTESNAPTATPASGEGRTRLAQVSFALALASLAAAVLRLLLLVFAGALPPEVFPLVNWVILILYGGAFLASMVALVTGVLALVRAKRYASPQRRRGWATAGLVMGSVVTVLLVFPGGFLFLL